MPFVELSDIKPFVKKSIYTALAAVESGTTTYFSLIEPEASKHISDLAGIDVPDSTSDRPDWIVQPASLIVQYYAKNLLSEVSNEFQESILKDYEFAKSLIAMHPPDDFNDLPDSKSFTGEIEDLIEW